MLFAICVSASLFLGDCRKDTTPPTPPPDPIDTTDVPIDTPPINHVIDLGKHFVSKNNVPWTAQMKAYYNKYKNMVNLIAESKYSNGFEDMVDIRDVPIKPGKYQYEYSPGVAKYNNFIPQVSFYVNYDGDQLVGAFSIDTTKLGNFVEVVRYDSIKHTIEGFYQARMFNRYSPFPGVPDSMFLLNGRFHLKIDTI